MKPRTFQLGRTVMAGLVAVPLALSAQPATELEVVSESGLSSLGVSLERVERIERLLDDAVASGRANPVTG